MDRPGGGELKGSLKKWSKFWYQRGWFRLLRGSPIVEYFKEEQDLHRAEEITPVGRIVLTESILVDTDYDGENRYFSLVGNRDVWYLEAESRDDKKLWVYNLTGKGARRMTVEEYRRYQIYGELIPSLNFPTVKGQDALSMKREEKTILEKSYSLIVSGFGSAASAGMSFVPGGTIIPLAAGGVVIGGAKVYDFFNSPDLDKMEKNLVNRIQRQIFRNDIIRLQSELSATERRYKMILNWELTDAQRQMEVTIAMHSFETILRLFHLPGNSFLENAFMMAPYLASFSTLYLLFAQVAVHVHPSYKNTIIEGIVALENCLLLYKETAILQRLNGITLNSHHFSRYDYVRDEKYPSVKDGLQNQIAYVDYQKYQNGKQFLEEYKDNIMNLYSAYFDDKIRVINKSKSKLNESSREIRASPIKSIVISKDTKTSHAKEMHMTHFVFAILALLFSVIVYYLLFNI